MLNTHYFTHFPQSLLKLLLFFMYSGEPTARWPVWEFTPE